MASGSHTEGILSSCCCRETRVGEQIRTAEGMRHTAFSEQVAENIKVKAKKAVVDSAFYDIKWQLNEGYLRGSLAQMVAHGPVASQKQRLSVSARCPGRKEEKKTVRELSEKVLQIFQQESKL